MNNSQHVTSLSPESSVIAPRKTQKEKSKECATARYNMLTKKIARRYRILDKLWKQQKDIEGKINFQLLIISDLERQIKSRKTKEADGQP